MQSIRKETRFIKLAKKVKNIVVRSHIPLRFSKFSNHIYDNHIHLVLLVLKAKSGMGYEEFMLWIENFTGLWELLELDRVPHFTTLHKFAGRVPRRYLDLVITQSSVEGFSGDLYTAIDSTGFSLSNASVYYTIVLERYAKKRKRGRPRKKKVRKYLKVTFVVDIHQQFILIVSVRRGPDNDNKDFIPSYKKLNRLDGRNLEQVLADKGYDSEANHEFIRDVLDADTIIPARRNHSKDYKTKGKYRREMKKGYCKKAYNQRNMVETVNSVVKRKMGDSIRARRVLYQNREIFFMVIAYNIDRSMSIFLFVLRGFLESRLGRKGLN